MRLRRALIVVALFPVLLGAGFDPPVPDSGALEYDITRDGDKIGTHRFVFLRQGAALIVTTTVDVAVKFAFVTVYRFHKTARETWRDGRVINFRSETDDNGTEIKARADSGPEGMVAIGPKGRVVAPPGTMISGYWNAATVGRRVLIDSEDGTLVPIKVEGGGTAEIVIDGHRVRTRHYRIKGELARELWYGPDGLLVKMRLIGSDGSIIDTVSR